MLTHYIFVRSDLPVGLIAAMVTHAAGETAADYFTTHEGNTTGMYAVVLEAKDEPELEKARAYLKTLEPHVLHVPIYDSVVKGRYHEELLAIGVEPIERGLGNVLFRKFQTLKSCKA